MSEYTTMAEIKAKFPNEWVLVDNLKKGRDGMAVGGAAITHSAERDIVYHAAGVLPIPRDVTIFHTGPIPEDVLFIL